MQSIEESNGWTMWGGSSSPAPPNEVWMVNPSAVTTRRRADASARCRSGSRTAGPVNSRPNHRRPTGRCRNRPWSWSSNVRCSRYWEKCGSPGVQVRHMRTPRNAGVTTGTGRPSLGWKYRGPVPSRVAGRIPMHREAVESPTVSVPRGCALPEALRKGIQPHAARTRAPAARRTERPGRSCRRGGPSPLTKRGSRARRGGPQG